MSPPSLSCQCIAPISAAVPPGSRVLLAGAGGGYDVLGALPLLVELESRGCTVELAGISFCALSRLAGARKDPTPNLFAVPGEAATPDHYCPEAWLARWLSERSGRPRVVWAIEKTGVRPLRAVYAELVSRFGIDALILVDGGVDALLRGDETSIGTPAEDLASLGAVLGLEGPKKLLACVGMTAELKDGICHAQVFERIAELDRAGGYFGASSLLRSSPAGEAYLATLDFVFAGQFRQRRSHVQRLIAESMRGQFGGDEPFVWRSPLLNMFWFFDAAIVGKTHAFLEHLLETTSIGELTLFIEGLRKSLRARERQSMPI